MCKFSIVLAAAGLFINLAGMFFFFIVILTPFFVCMHFFFFFEKCVKMLKTRRKHGEKIVSCLHANTKSANLCIARSLFLKSHVMDDFFCCWNETVKRYYTPTVIWNLLENYNFIQQCSSSLVYSHFIQWFRINTF